MAADTKTSGKKTPASKDEADGIVIKKYANRRLYNTATSRYVTLEDLCAMVKEGQEFVVVDAKSGADLTRSVLTQIIVEEEAKGQNLLPIGFLRQLIGMYGDNMQWMVPTYLEQSMSAFQANQERMREYLTKTLGGMFPMSSFEELNKTNIAMFEQAMRMFSPFSAGPGASAANGMEDAKAANAKASATDHDDIDKLKGQIDALEQQLKTISDSTK